MTFSSAYLFAKQITAGEVPVEPLIVFENGVWNKTDALSPYWNASMSCPIAPGNFTTNREQTMAEYGKDNYDYAYNLYALGRQYTNVYSLTTTNITRQCTTGAYWDECAATMFLPLNSLRESKRKIIVEYKITDAHDYDYIKITIGAIRLNGNAYETIAQETATDKGNWNTLTVTLPSPEVIKAIEIQSGYGIYEIRKIWLE